MIIFADKIYFLLLLLLIPMIVWYVLKYRNSHAAIKTSTIRGAAQVPKTYKHYFKHFPFIFRMLAFVSLVFILARPQKTDSMTNESVEGIDIMMAVDISTSMLAQDLKPNRLEASKNVASEFIGSRPNDNIGLVLFAAESFTQCPLTTDHVALNNLLRPVKAGMIEDGTAIGLGLATAVNRIKDSEAISRVIILLTDGSNNRGEISPVHAAEIAKTFGIRVYTIGVGTKGMAQMPVRTHFGIRYENVKVDIDENTLKQIAAITGGTYFRATDNETLKSIYNEIDQLEKSKINVREYQKKTEEFMWFAIPLLFFLLCEIIFRNTVLRHIP